jgi:hypothetical protein
VATNTLPFANGEFDVVFSATELMHHVDDVVGPLIGEMCRCSRGDVVLFEEVAPRRHEKYSYVKPTAAE